MFEIKEPYLKGVFRILSIIKDVAFCKIITDEIPLTIFAKRLILDIWQGSGYTSDLSNSIWSKVSNCQIEKLLQEILITLKLVTVSCFSKDAGLLLTLKRPDGGRSIWLHFLWFFKKCTFQRECTFDIIISHIFSENFIEIPQIVQKIRRFSCSIRTISSIFWIFWHFLVTKKLMTGTYIKWNQHFFTLKLL